MVELAFARLQIAIFLTALDLSRRLDLAVAIRQASNSLLDADPLIVPLPDDAPPEIPRLQIRSRDGVWTSAFTGSRMDIVYELRPEKLGPITFDQAMSEQAAIAKSIWNALQSAYSASGNRIGVVAWFLGRADNAVQYLRARWLVHSDAPEPHELQIHSLHRMTVGQHAMNRWTRCFAEASKNVIRLEVDVNTQPEQRFDVTPASIAWFLESAHSLITNAQASLFQTESSPERVF
jgi:hypothetical protein